MHKIKVLCFFLLIWVSVLRSQQATDNVFTLKPSLGINGCQIHGDSYSGYDKLGVFAGVAVNSRLKNEKTSLELGFYFSQKGSRHVPTKHDPSFYNLNLNFIDLPLSIRYKVNSSYFITFGPSVAYLISHKENRNYSDETGFYKYNRYELGINVGLGRKIKDRMSVELRCSNSLTPVRKIIANVYYSNPVARTFKNGYYSNLLSIFLTYNIALKQQRGSD